MRNSRLVDVSFRSPIPSSPTQQRPLLRDLHPQNLHSSSGPSKEASGCVEQLAESRRREHAKPPQRYREQNDAVSARSSARTSLSRNWPSLNAPVTKAITERELRKRALYRQLQDRRSPPPQWGKRSDTFPQILSNAFIQRQKGN